MFIGAFFHTTTGTYSLRLHPQYVFIFGVWSKIMCSWGKYACVQSRVSALRTLLRIVVWPELDWERSTEWTIDFILIALVPHLLRLMLTLMKSLS